MAVFIYSLPRKISGTNELSFEQFANYQILTDIPITLHFNGQTFSLHNYNR